MDLETDKRVVKKTVNDHSSCVEDPNLLEAQEMTTDDTDELDYQDVNPNDSNFVSDEIPKGSDEFLSEGEIYSDEEESNVTNDAYLPSNGSHDGVDMASVKSESEVQLNIRPLGDEE